MRLQTMMTADEMAVLADLRKPIPIGARIVAGQWVLRYAKDEWVSAEFWGEIKAISTRWGLYFAIRRTRIFDGIKDYTVTIGHDI